MDLSLGNTQVLINRAKKVDMLRNQLAYVLATAYWETGRSMKPVREAYWVFSDPVKLDHFLKTHTPSSRYYPWYGRGYVQLTWEANYKSAGNKLGVDLISNKDLALDPKIAADIAILGMTEGWFTGKKLSDFITLKKSDFFNARVIINGDKNKIEKSSGKKIGVLIEEFAKTYDKLLREVGYGEGIPIDNGVVTRPLVVKASPSLVQPIPDDPGVIPPKERETSVEHSPGFSEPATSFIDSLIKLLIQLFGAKK